MTLQTLEPTLNKELNRIREGDTTNELSLTVTGLNLDAPFSRNLVLCKWVEIHIVKEQFHFESSSNLYSFYAKDVAAEYGSGCTFPKVLFYKEIDCILESYGLVIIKVRDNVGRGYRGLKYLNK